MHEMRGQDEMVEVVPWVPWRWQLSSRQHFVFVPIGFEKAEKANPAVLKRPTVEEQRRPKNLSWPVYSEVDLIEGTRDAGVTGRVEANLAVLETW